MNLRQLKTFIRVAELGSLSSASDQMRIAQPALSRQMKVLQEEIGVPLFARHRRGMQLTEAGQELLSRVPGLIRQLDQAYEDVRALSGAARGRVAFGIVPTASYVLAGRLARRVATEFPGISLRIVEGYGGHLIEWLQRGQIDAAIIYGPHSDLHMRLEELLLENLVLVGPPGSGLSPKIPVSVAAFAKLPLVLPSRPHGLRVVVDSAAAKAKVKLQIRIEADSFRVLTDLVEKGLGYTALPLSSIEREYKDRRLEYAPLVQPTVTRQLILGFPDSTVSRATRTVVGLVREEVVALARSGEWQVKLQFTPARAR